MTCHGLGCTCTKLIDAHIIPRGFARDIMGSHTHNMQVSMDRARVTQHGVYDPKILCAECDGKLGVYDDYAIEICRRFNAEKILFGDLIWRVRRRVRLPSAVANRV